MTGLQIKTSFISEQGPVNESTQARSFENLEQYVAAVYDQDVRHFAWADAETQISASIQDIQMWTQTHDCRSP